MNSPYTYQQTILVKQNSRVTTLKTILLIFFLTVVYQYGIAQKTKTNPKGTYREIRKFYQELNESDLPAIRFLRVEDSTVINNHIIRQIMMIRHGAPLVDKKGWLNFYDMVRYMYQYDTVHVEPVLDGKPDIDTQDIDVVYSSSLVRSSHTAQMMFGDQFEIIEDSSFIEFQREAFPIPAIRMPLACWQVISRFFWFIGIHTDNIESYPKARQRAWDAAIFLEIEATKSGRSVLVAHGFLNRSIKKALKKQGWDISLDTGKGYLSVQILSKID